MNNNMYLYFDSNGYLKEFITCPARAGSENVNSIYFYVEPALESDRNKVDGNGDAYFALPNNLDHGVLTFKLHDVLDGVTDEDGVVLNSLAFTSANFRIEDIQPFDKKRDLLFFKWFQKYQFVKVDLTADILLNAGNVECTIGCYNSSNTKVYNLDLFSFYVADSAVQSANYITTSQYHMLLALMQSGLSSAVMRHNISSGDTLADIYDLIGTQIVILNVEGDEYLAEMSGDTNIVLCDIHNREWYVFSGSNSTVIDDVINNQYKVTYVQHRNQSGNNAYVSVSGTDTLMKISSNAEGGIMSRNSSGQTKVGDPTDDAHAANKGYVDGKVADLGNLFTYKGAASVAEINALRNIGNGWAYNLSDSGTLTLGNLQVETGDNVAFNGTIWTKLSSETILGQYYTKQEGQAFEQGIDERVTSVENELSSVASGSPKGVYSTLADLQTAYPTGAEGIYIVGADWYYWNGSAWTDGGVYLSTANAVPETRTIVGTSLEDNITGEELEDGLIFERDIESLKVENVVGTAENGYVNKQGEIQSGTWARRVYTVEPNKIYLLTNYFDATYQPTITFFDNNDNFISFVQLAAKLYCKKIKIPSNCYKIMVNTLGNTSNSVYPSCLFKVIGYEAKDKKLNTIIRNSFNSAYEDVQFDAQTTGLNALNNLTPNATYILGFKKVCGGEKYKFMSNVGGNNYIYAIYDINGTLLDYDQQASFLTREYELVMPEKAFSMVICSDYRIPINLRIAKNVYTNLDFDESNYKTMIINEQLKNDFAWKSNHINMATFTFDDANSDIDALAAMFEEHNVPICLAVIPMKLDDVCNGLSAAKGSFTVGMTVRQVCQKVVELGGEILCHWQTPLTSSSTDEDYENVYIGAKKTLFYEGFVTYGIITAGGTNYQTQDFAKDIELARPYYLYADLTATGFLNVEQYYNRRNFLDGGVDDVKSIVDDFLQNGQLSHSRWLNFASHGTNTTSLADLTTMLEYVISKGITVTTWKNVYDTYKSSKLEKRIEALE